MNFIITKSFLSVMILILSINHYHGQVPHGDRGLKKRVKISYNANFVDTTITKFDTAGIQTFPIRNNVTTTRLTKCDTLADFENSKHFVYYYADSSISKFQYTKYNDSIITVIWNFPDSLNGTSPKYSDVYKKLYTSKNLFFEKGKEIFLQYEGTENSLSFSDTISFTKNRITNVYRILSINEYNGESYVSEKTKQNRKGAAKKSRIRFYNEYFNKYFDEKYSYSYDSNGRIATVVQYDTKPKIITTIIYYEYY